MDRVFVFILMVSVLAIAVLGVFLVGHTAAHNNCIAALANRGICPENDPAGYINFHFGAFQSVSKGVLERAQNGVGVLFALALLLMVAARRYAAIFPLAQFLSYRRDRRENFSPPIIRTFLSWLALHEVSPTLV